MSELPDDFVAHHRREQNRQSPEKRLAADQPEHVETPQSVDGDDSRGTRYVTKRFHVGSFHTIMMDGVQRTGWLAAGSADLVTDRHAVVLFHRRADDHGVVVGAGLDIVEVVLHFAGGLDHIVGYDD